MSTVTATAPGTFDQETHHKKNTWAKVLPIIGIVSSSTAWRRSTGCWCPRCVPTRRSSTTPGGQPIRRWRITRQSSSRATTFCAAC